LATASWLAVLQGAAEPSCNIGTGGAFGSKGNLEAGMNNRDETIREKLLERLTAVDVDARNLAVEVAAGTVIVRGSVPTEQQRERTIEALAGARSIEIFVRPVAPVDGE
jgi:osmotically-inducible protein OsmY